MSGVDFIAHGLVEFLQMVSPSWATKLTRERLASVKRLLDVAKERDELLAALKRIVGAVERVGSPTPVDGIAEDCQVVIAKAEKS